MVIDYWLFIPACFALNLAFGPNNLLAMTHGATVGAGFAVRAGTGRLVAFAPMIALTGLGLGVILSASALVFTGLKIIGALYLIWLGLRLLRAAPTAITVTKARPDFACAFRREMLVAAGNPKAILIFAAFFPQFIDPQAYAASYAVLGGLFLVLELGAIAAYAGLGHLAARVASDKMHWINRASGAVMMLFGVGLLFAGRPGAT